MPTEVIFTDSEPIYGEAPARAGNFENKGEKIRSEKSAAPAPQSKKYEEFLIGLTPSWKVASFQATSADGCGSGWNVHLVPDYFPECCNAHDIAYGTLGVSKLDADTAFLRCMLLDANTPGIIDMPGLNLIRSINRISAANFFYGAVRAGGDGPYQEAQAKARDALRFSEPSVLRNPDASAPGNRWLP